MGLSLGTFTGICCGLAIAYLRVSPLVVTLGVGSILSGLALIFSNGQPVSEVGRGFSDLFYSAQLGIPAPIWIVFVLSLVLAHLLNNRVVGKHIRAVGSNERAAQLSGVPVRKTTVIAYALCGSMTSLGAILLASRISSGHPTVGSDTALQAIAAAVIGGVSLFGGRGSILGALLGALFLGLLSNALNLLNVSSFSQLIAVGVAILAAVIIDRLRIWGRT
jgi:ribose/xylose/arabinose/galactoside ABC-type transport system permease subunit